MLLILFEAGGQRYALDCTTVTEVIPLVNTRPIPHAPDYVTGMFRFKGNPVPVVDLHQLLAGEACPKRMSTRILLSSIAFEDGKRFLGLMAERATQAMKAKAGDFRPPGIEVEDAPYLGGIAGSGSDMVQLIKVEKLLPEKLKTMLFAQGADQ